MPDKPNILFIILDTLRRDRLSLYGEQCQTSPCLDDFAQDATVFDRAIAPAQWTIPAHGSLFSGLYPTTHQLTQAAQSLPDSYPTLAELLRLAEYRTVAFCNNPLVGVLNNGLQRGFDHFYNYAGATPNRPLDSGRNSLTRTALHQWQQFGRLATNQFTNNDLLFRLGLNETLTPLWTRFANFTGDTAKSIDDLIDYLKDHQQTEPDMPLFTYVNLMGAHLPYRPPRDYLEQIAPDIAKDKRALRYMSEFNNQPQTWTSPPDVPLEDWQTHTLDGYYATSIAYQDYHLGRLLKYMRESGELDNTLVIIAADHGEGHGDHEFIGHSFVIYQELVHVPMVIRYPERFPVGQRIAENISTRRLFHTILNIADAKLHFDTDNPNYDIENLSLTRVMEGDNIEQNQAFAEAFPPLPILKVLQDRKPTLTNRLKLTQIRRGIYHDDVKLAIVGDDVEQFFNVADDPFEQHNHATQHAEQVENLQSTLMEFIEHKTAIRTSESQSQELDTTVMDSLRALGYME